MQRYCENANVSGMDRWNGRVPDRWIKMRRQVKRNIMVAEVRNNYPWAWPAAF